MIKKIATGGLLAAVAVVAFASISSAATTIVVTLTDQQGWSTSDTRPGGAVNFVADATSPLPGGALQLTTNASTTAKAQYLHATNTPLAAVTDLSYYTKYVSGPDYAAPSYQLIVLLNGTTTGFTTLVYEPYQNGTVSSTTWQQWDVDAGQFWSSRTFTDGTCSVTAGGGGAPFYTLAGLQAACPSAVVVGFGVNIGSNNPSYDVYTDAVVFNDTTYNFELVAPDTTPPDAPTPVSPANGATTTTIALDKVDWTDVTDASSTPVTYVYEAALSPATTSTGAFVAPIYVSGPLTASEIPTAGTPEGTYFWHVNASDSVGNVSPWSVTWSFTVDNTVVPPPATTTPTTKDECKNDGWKTFTNPTFKNQGQCVSFITSNR